jgi:parallel beta-helix repeat protein
LPITNCVFKQNNRAAISIGSGYDNVISNCTIINNFSHGIDCNGGTVRISNCTIKNNGQNADGDGILVYNSSKATIENCIISGNQEDGIDAGNNSSVIVKNCVIANNGIEGTNEGYGIGFYGGSTGTIESCEILGSYRDGIYLDHSEPQAVIQNNTIVDNKRNGIYANSAIAIITGCNISQNDYDGIDCSNGSTLEISDCIIKGNGIEGSDAAGLTIYSCSSDGVWIHNSIIAYNRYWGVWCSISANADATNNWWGHSSGPYHENLNPDGLGDVVSDRVLIEPWLPTAPPLEPTCPGEPGDVSGDGTVSAYDAALILQFVVGLINEFPIQQVGAPDDNIAPRHYTVSVAEHFTQAGKKIIVPILIDDADGLLAGGISLKYDPTILRAVDVFPTTLINGSYWKANTSLEGEIRFAFAAAEPSKGKGNLLMVEFEVMPHTEGQTTSLILDNVSLSDSLNITRINGSVTVLPSRTRLLQNFPNPFNPETWLPYQLAEDADVTIRIYTAKGQIVRSLPLGRQRAGNYTTKTTAAYWNGRDNYGERVASGLYFYTLHAGEIKATRKMTILK